MHVKDHDCQSLHLLVALSCIQRGGVVKAMAQISAVRRFLLWPRGGINKRPSFVEEGWVPSVADWHPVDASHAVGGVPVTFRFFPVCL